MKYFITAFLLLCSITFAQEEQKMSVAKVMQNKIYENVQINELEPLKIQNANSNKPRGRVQNKIDKAVANKALRNLKIIHKKFTNFPLPNIEIESGYGADTDFTLSGKNQDCYIYASYNNQAEITYFSLSQNTVPLRGNEQVTNKLFLAYATKVYAMIFEAPPLGVASFQYNKDDLVSVFEEERCVWQNTLKGVKYPEFGVVHLRHNKEIGRFKWSLVAIIGCTANDEKLISDFLSKHPINLTKDEAYALAVKASIQLGISHKGEDTWFTYSVMGQSLAPSMPAHFIPEKTIKQWKAKGADKISLITPIFCTKVTIADGLDLNEFFIDWTTKNIIHVNSYRQSW